MLKKFNKGMLAIVAAASFIAAVPAKAETVDVLILETAYFPEVVFVSEGDTLVFTNQSGSEHTIMGQDDAWTTEAIAAGGSFSMPVSSELHQSFSGNDVDGVSMTATLDYTGSD
ncbi:MAG: hypothetical protein ACSHWZ_03055 [Sulfitobacter sp.]